jgi:small subunit ribosomal protein S10
MAKKSIRIKLKSYDHSLLDVSVANIINAAHRTGASVRGPIPLPTHKEIFCVLRSPHVDKKSREHFEIRTHKRLLDISDASAKTMDALTALDMPAGVEIEIKV